MEGRKEGRCVYLWGLGGEDRIEETHVNNSRQFQYAANHLYMLF